MGTEQSISIFVNLISMDSVIHLGLCEATSTERFIMVGQQHIESHGSERLLF